MTKHCCDDGRMIVVLAEFKPHIRLRAERRTDFTRNFARIVNHAASFADIMILVAEVFHRLPWREFLLPAADRRKEADRPREGVR